MKSILQILFLGMVLSCNGQQSEILPGSFQMEAYLPLLENKRIALTVNHTSMVRNAHLTDTLLSLNYPVVRVFSPEHGFRGMASDGEEVEYEGSELPFDLISLYGKNKKPTHEQLQNVDIMVFDIQDVGARFYTYISTMQYVMEACAESSIPVIVLDRPNPNGSYIDGPVLDTACRSFVGLNPIPIVYGMTIGELAQMINGEGWLANGINCDLQVVKIKNWKHSDNYSLPVKPSPNLPNDLSIALYPSLCLFEGTVMSVGRGTDFPFQQIGHPDYPVQTYSFVPTPNKGAKWPPQEGKTCYGVSFIGAQPQYRFSLSLLIQTYEMMDLQGFFNNYFEKLAGNRTLQRQIEEGMSEEEIRKTWQKDLDDFKRKRKQYLLYE